MTKRSALIRAAIDAASAIPSVPVRLELVTAPPAIPAWFATARDGMPLDDWQAAHQAATADVRAAHEARMDASDRATCLDLAATAYLLNQTSREDAHRHSDWTRRLDVLKAMAAELNAVASARQADYDRLSALHDELLNIEPAPGC